MAFTQTKNVDTESFIKARIRIRSQTSGSDQKGPDQLDQDPQHCLYVKKIRPIRYCFLIDLVMTVKRKNIYFMKRNCLNQRNETKLDKILQNETKLDEM
jgi:hypothetical protein